MRKRTEKATAIRRGLLIGALLLLMLMLSAPALAFQEQQSRQIEITGFLPAYREIHFRPESVEALTPLNEGLCTIGTVECDWKFNGEQPWFLRVWIDDVGLVADQPAEKGEFRILIWCPNFGNNVNPGGQLHERDDVGIPPIVEETLRPGEGQEANWLRIPFASEMVESEIWMLEENPTHRLEPNRYEWRVLMGVDVSDMRISRGNPQRFQIDWNKAGDLTIVPPFTLALAVDWGLYDTNRPSVEIPLVFQFVTGREARPVYEKILPMTLRLTVPMFMFDLDEEEGE